MDKTDSGQDNDMTRRLRLFFAFVLALASAAEAGADGGQDVKFFHLSLPPGHEAVWLKAAVDSMAPAIFRLPDHAQCLEAVRCVGPWCMVDYRGKEGWMEKRFLKPAGNCRKILAERKPLEKSCHAIGAVAKYIEEEKICICPYGKRWNEDRTLCLENPDQPGVPDLF